MSQSPSSAQQLRALVDQPEQQARFAITLLRPKQSRDLLVTALDAVRRFPLEEARAPLLALYDFFSQQPEKRDAGGYMRSPILNALRPLATPADLSLLLGATMTYERYPPRFEEEAGLVRAAGLIALNEVDEDLARYHAARLLADLAHLEPMSGEPAVTALGLLAAHEETLPLYLYAMLPPSPSRSEVTAECLRRLTSLSPEMIDPLLAHYAECTDSVILIGLFDLLLGHEAGIQGEEFIATLLAQAQELDLFRYFTTALVAAGEASLLDLLLAALHWETDRRRLAIARDALLLRADEAHVADAIARLEEKL